jgi:threonine/homoserine/homoserine lactone efflux protein
MGKFLLKVVGAMVLTWVGIVLFAGVQEVRRRRSTRVVSYD